MKREFLEAMGLDKEQIDKILDQNGTEVSALNARIKAKDTEIGTLRTDLATANTSLADAQSKLDSAYGEDIETLKKELENEKNARKADLERYKMLEFLAKHGCVDSDYVLYKSGKDFVFDEGGEIKDVENLAKSLKDKHPAFFSDSATSKGTGSIGNFPRQHSGKTPASENPYSKAGWNLTKQMELELTDPDLAKKLKSEAAQ